MFYHYKDSGLDDIYLENGVDEQDTPYGKAVSIEDSEGLHKAIGRWLIERPTPLNGAELRFLRVEMELTQRSLAGIIGATEQTLRLWEKHREKFINAIADRLVRTLYAECLGDDQDIRTMLERLADLDRREHESTCFRRAKHSWKPQKVRTGIPCEDDRQTA